MHQNRQPHVAASCHNPAKQTANQRIKKEVRNVQAAKAVCQRTHNNKRFVAILNQPFV